MRRCGFSNTITCSQHKHWNKYYSEINYSPFECLNTDENLIISANAIPAVQGSVHRFCQHLSSGLQSYKMHI